MKFYLAAAYKERDRLREYAKELRAKGHEVTSRWLRERAEPDTVLTTETVKDYRKNAEVDVKDILDAECFVLFTVAPETPILRGGKHFEAGLAYGLKGFAEFVGPGKLAVIGPNENIFYNLPEWEHYDTWEEFFASLK